MLNIFLCDILHVLLIDREVTDFQTEVQTSHFYGVITSLIFYYLKHAYKKQLHFLCILFIISAKQFP